MAREQEDAMAEAPARRASPDASVAAETTAQQSEAASQAPAGPGAVTASIHRSLGNAVVHAALAGDGVGPMGSLVAGSVMMDAVGVGGASALGSNTSVMRSMASEGLQPDKADMAALKGPGKPLPEGVRDRMERAFEQDFSKVRIHTDSGANKASKAFNALAMTLGYDIFFKENVGDFKTKQQQQLLAHELTHVQQFIEGKISQSQGSAREAHRFGMGDLIGKIPGMEEVTQALGGAAGKAGIEVSDPSDALEQEAYGNEGNILKKLGQLDKMFQLEEQIAKVVGKEPGQLLQMFEQAAGGQLEPKVAEQLFKALGTSVKAADPKALHDIESVIGKGLVGLGQSLMPEDTVATEERNGTADSVDTLLAGTAKGRSEGDAGGGPEVAEAKGDQVAKKNLIAAPLQVARSAFRDRLTPSSKMEGTGTAEIQQVSGGDFAAKNPLRTILDARHGAFADKKFEGVIDAMAQAMSGADAFGYDSGRIIQAGADEMTTQIEGAPEGDRVRTALKMARQGSNISLPYKQRLLQDLRHLLEDGEGGIDSTMLDNINVYVSDPSCRSLSAEAYAIGNMVCFKDGAPSYELVKEEVTHVIQQGGHLSSLQSIPSSVGVTSPTDAVEVEARGIAGTHVAPDAVSNSGIQVARSISIGETQGEVFQAVVQGAIPDGYSQIMNTWVGEGSAIQAGEDAVKNVINSSVAFPLDKVDSLFSGDQFGVLDPNTFQESLKHSNDNIVTEVVDLVMGICDKALSVLDGIIGVVTEIMNIVESFVQLLESIANAMNVFGAILIGIGTGLCFVVIPAGIGSQFIQWGTDLLNIGQKAQNLADKVQKIIEPLQKAIEKIEQVKEKIEQIREICGTIQECLDVYEWFMSDTSNERLTSAENLNASSERSGELMSQLGGGRYSEYATKFWENSRPVIDYVLEGETEITPVDEQSTPAPLGFSVPGVAESSPDAAQDPSGVQEAFAQKKSERTGEGSDVYKDIVEPISWPSFFKPKPSDGIKVVTNFIGGGSAGDAGMPGAPTHTHPGQTVGGGPGSGSSIVSGAMGEVGTLAQTPLNTESLVTDAVQFTQHALDLGGYPSDIAETFDYLNNVIQYQEVSASLETQGSQRMQESRVLQENAQNSITAAQNLIDISNDQEASAQYNEEQGHEGVGFTDYLMKLSQDLQAELIDKMNRMTEGMNLTDQAGQEAMQSEANAESGMASGNQLAMQGGGIASMLAQALIQVIIQQAMQQILSGAFLKELIPGDLGKIMELGTTFLSTAQGSHDRAVEKENESAIAQQTYNQAIATDQASQARAQQTRSEAEEMKATAEETLSKAEQGEADATELRERARQLDVTLKNEQSTAESNTASNLSEAGPMRPRVTPEYVQTPGSWPWAGQGISNPRSARPGSTVTNVDQLPVSSDMGHPHPVAGPVPTNLIEATPLPFVASSIFQATLDAYRTFGNPNVVVGPAKTPTMPAATQAAVVGSDGDQGARVQADPILVEGSSGYDPGYTAAPAPEASNADLVTERDLAPDTAAAHGRNEEQARDVQPPLTAEAQQARATKPFSDAVAAQEVERFDQVRTAQGLIPTAEHIYHTLEPLPQMLPPQPEFADLQPMQTEGLGYNAQQILIDGDIAAIQGWIGTLPRDVRLLGPGRSDGLSMPDIQQPSVRSAAGAAVPQVEALQLPDVPVLDVPQFPGTDALRANPERFDLHADVDHPSELLRDAYDEVLDRVHGHVDQHVEQETSLLDRAGQRVQEAQRNQTERTVAALTRRDQVFREIRQWMIDKQVREVQSLEADATEYEEYYFQRMERYLTSGRGDADAILRDGEAQARSFEERASQAAGQIHGEALAKSTTLWGWFRTEASSFTANVAMMLNNLWNSANQAVEQSLVQSHVGAMRTLVSASQRATEQLAELDSDLPDFYAHAREEMAEIGDDGRWYIQEAIDDCRREMQRSSQLAARVVQQIIERTQEQIERNAAATERRVGREWEIFDELAEELRAAKEVPPIRIEDPQPGADVEQPLPSHPDAERDHGADDPAAPSISVTAETARPVGASAPQAHAPAQATPGQEVTTAFETFRTATPTDKASTWIDTDTQLSQAHRADEQAFQQQLEPLHGRLSGETGRAPSRVEAPTAALAEHNEGSTPSVELERERAEQRRVADAPQLANWNEPSPEMDAVPNAEEVSTRFNEIPITDDSIVTSPGPAPQVPTEGAANPRRMNALIGDGLQTAHEATVAAQEAVRTSPAPHEVLVPRELHHEVLPAPLSPPGDLQEVASVEGMDKYTGLGLPGDVTAEFDSMYGDEMAAALQDPASQLESDIAAKVQERNAAIADAHSEAHRVSMEQHQAQVDAVDAKRQEVAAKRTEVMQAQSAALDEFSTKAKAEHAKQYQAASERINSTQRNVNEAFNEAQRAAEQRVRQGEEEAARKKRDAERDANDKKWWEFAVDWVADQLRSLADAINDIFQAVRDAVVDIINEAKELATRLISEAVDFVKSAISAYAEFLKAEIDLIIGSVFPQLAAELNAFVDEAAAFVQSVVDEAERFVIDFVDELAQKLIDGLDTILLALEGLVDITLGVAYGILTGDWVQAIKMAFDAVLKLAGIEPGDFYGVLSQAENVLHFILENPGLFVSRTIDAGGQGFGQFAENFLDHMRTQFIDWATEKVIDYGLNLAGEKFNAKGLFAGTTDAAGIDEAYVEDETRRLAGDDNVARFAHAWQQVEEKISGGVVGLYEDVADKVSPIWSSVRDTVQNWLLTQIAQRAVAKFLSMFVPGGALVQAVMTGWDVYVWFREKMQQIMEVVTAVIGNAQAIVMGNLSAAADGIESALASMIPLALDLLAQVFGLPDGDDKAGEEAEEAATPIRDAIKDFLQGIVDEFDPESYLGMHDDQAGDNKQEFVDEQGEDHALWMEADGTTHLASVQGRYTEHTTQETHDFYYLDDGDRSQLTSWGVLTEEGVIAGRDGDWQSVMDAADALNEAASQLPGMELPATPHIDDKEEEADAKKDDGSQAEGRDPGGSSQDGDGASADGGNLDANAATVSEQGIDPASLPTELEAWDQVGEAIGWFDEISKVDWFTDTLGNSVNAVPPKLTPAPSRWDLLGEALGQGALAGLKEGAFSIALDTLINVGSSKIPYLAGFIEVFQFAMNPVEYGSEVLKGLGFSSESKYVQGWNRIRSGDPVEFFQGMLDMADGVKDTIATLSKICWLVAGLGFIASIFFPVLVPFVALAAKWGVVFGTAATALGLALTGFRAIMIVAQSVKLLRADADPEELLEMQQTIRDQTKTFTQTWVERKGDAVRDHVQSRYQKRPTPEGPEPRTGTDNQSEQPNILVEALKFANPIPLNGRQAVTESYMEVKDLGKATFNLDNGYVFRTQDGQLAMDMEAAGIPVFMNQADREWYDGVMRTHERNDTQDYQRAHQEYNTAKQEYDRVSEMATQQQQKVQQAQADFAAARQRADALRTSGDGLPAAQEEVTFARQLVNAYDPAPAQDKARAADDVARRLQYESDLAPGDANKRLAAQDARTWADNLQREADDISSAHREAQDMLASAESHASNLAAAQRRKEEAEELARGEGLRLENERGTESAFSSVVEGAKTKSDVADAEQQKWIAGEEAFEQRIDRLNANTPFLGFIGGNLTGDAQGGGIYGQNLGAGKTGSLTGLISDASGVPQGIKEQAELDMEHDDNVYVESLQDLAEQMGTVEAGARTEALSEFTTANLETLEPGDSGWPDYEQQIKQSFEDTSAQLAGNPPPSEVPVEIDAASHGIQMLMEEHASLDADKQRLENTIAMTKETEAQLQAAQQIGRAQQQGIEQYVGVGDTLQTNQQKLEQEATQLEGRGTESESGGSDLQGHCMELVTGGIFEMFNLISGISRLTGRADGGDEKMRGLQNLGDQLPTAGSDARAWGAQEKAESKQWQTDTAKATSDAQQDQQEVEGTTSELESTHEEAVTVVGDLEAQRGEISSYEQELYGHRQTLADKHASAKERGIQWVDSSRQVREAGITSITTLIEDVYNHRKQA